jgi:hypothetical protein
MLLIELVKLFSSQLNINEDEFNIIIANNNIKLNQCLTLEKKEKKEKKVLDNTTPSININNEEVTHNVKEKRSRGRPKKQCNVVTETNNIDEDVNYEIVEELTYDNKVYYKTDKGVLLDTNYNAQGVIVDGVVLMK